MSNSSVSADIKLRIENLNKSIVQYKELQNTIFGNRIYTNVNLHLGLPYYIQHAESKKVLTMGNISGYPLFLEDKPQVLKPSQEWIITNIDPSNNGINYTITSNTNKTKCISYIDNEVTPQGYTLKIIDCGSANANANANSISNSNWKIDNYNDAYKNIMVGQNTAFVLDNSLNNLTDDTTEDKLIINNILLESETINSQCWIIKPNPSAFFKMRDDIYKEIIKIKNLVKNILPNKVNNNAEIKFNSMKIEETILKIDDEMAKLAYKTQQIIDNNPDYDPELLEGKYQYTKLNTNTSFYNYIMYIFFALFIIVSLIYIYIHPDETSLDMFIVSLAVFILMYYIYDYFKNKK